jgi:hypothetical protein
LPNFIRYDRRAGVGVGGAPEPSVTIQRRGNFGLNHPAFILADEPEAVELLYDPDEKIIGLRKVDPSEPYAFRVRKQPKSRSYLFGAGSFLKHFGLQSDETRRYAPKMIDDVLTINLNEGVTVGRSGAASRGKA